MLVIQIIAGRKYVPISIFNKANIKCLIATIIMTLIILPIIFIVNNTWLQMILTTVVSATVYGIILVWSKDDIVLSILKYITKI